MKLLTKDGNTEPEVSNIYMSVYRKSSINGMKCNTNIMLRFSCSVFLCTHGPVYIIKSLIYRQQWRLRALFLMLTFLSQKYSSTVNIFHIQVRSSLHSTTRKKMQTHHDLLSTPVHETFRNDAIKSVPSSRSDKKLFNIL